jgi:hypothetical protein
MIDSPLHLNLLLRIHPAVLRSNVSKDNTFKTPRTSGKTHTHLEKVEGRRRSSTIGWGKCGYRYNTTAEASQCNLYRELHSALCVGCSSMIIKKNEMLQMLRFFFLCSWLLLAQPRSLCLGRGCCVGCWLVAGVGVGAVPCVVTSCESEKSLYLSVKRVR